MMTDHDTESAVFLAIAMERERCAKIAEAVNVPHNGHPQMDPATIGDARRVIAAAIRGAIDDPHPLLQMGEDLRPTTFKAR